MPMPPHLSKEQKVRFVMDEFAKGKLHSSNGDLVTDRKQAVAIAMSEAGMARKRGKMGTHK